MKGKNFKQTLARTLNNIISIRVVKCSTSCFGDDFLCSSSRLLLRSYESETFHDGNCSEKHLLRKKHFLTFSSFRGFMVGGRSSRSLPLIYVDYNRQLFRQIALDKEIINLTYAEQSRHGTSLEKAVHATSHFIALYCDVFSCLAVIHLCHPRVAARFFLFLCRRLKKLHNFQMNRTFSSASSCRFSFPLLARFAGW
jgi:hypothetical protein